MPFDGRPNHLQTDRLVPRQRRAECFLHGVLTVAGRQLENLQVLPGRLAGPELPLQLIVGHAKMAGGKHVRLILVLLKRAGLTDQRVDHVPVVDGVFAGAQQPGHGLELDARPPDLDLIRVDHRLDGHPDQAAGNGVRVAADLDRAAAVDLDLGEPPPMIELLRRQFTQTGPFFSEAGGAVRVPPLDQLLEKLLVLRTTGEVAAAAEQERLIDHRLQVAVRRFNVAVLMRLTGIGPLRLEPIVVHQLLIPPVKLAAFRQVVDRGGQAVAAMSAGHAAQCPQRLLQATAHGLERFREADVGEFPVRVREREVIQQVLERLTPDGDS